MILSYNLSSEIKVLLSKIESLRQKILLYPIPPSIEQKLKWEMAVSRVFWSMSLSDNPLSQKWVENLIKLPTRKKLTAEQREVINYKSSLDYIQTDWFVVPKKVTPETIVKLYTLACLPTIKRRADISSEKQKDVNHFLDYLQTGSENPVIQAGIAQIQIIDIHPFEDGNARVARLLGLLFLYKYGFDFRGLLNLSEYFRRDVITLTGVTQSARKRENLTIWLEYYAKAVSSQLQKAHHAIEKAVREPIPDNAYWILSDRQKKILRLLDSPKSTLTNRKVRKNHKISQITASRDLSKLTSLGLISARGKGRSVYYSKV